MVSNKSLYVALEGKPVSTNSIYRYTCVGGSLRGYMTPQGKEMKDMYAWIFKGARPPGWKLDESYEVEVILYFADKRTHDVDNFCKILLDSATGIIWNDDKQVTKLTVSKAIDKALPRIGMVIHTV